ncbi:hypothetical protein Q1695_001685 [Nippostrongylus brasiliensis]|nr:hypothetical protein Q1695_001685 [Nippostrongylus brasiliensis]
MWTFVLLASISLVTPAFCDDGIRPAAIIPWSQYQMRLKQTQQLSDPYEFEAREKWSSNRQRLKVDDSLLNFYKHRPNAAKVDVEGNGFTSKSAIRPQLRRRVPLGSDVSRFNHKNYKQVARKEQLASRAYNHLRIPSTIPSDSVQNFAIPNGVSVHDGTWEGNRPNREPQKSPTLTFGSNRHSYEIEKAAVYEGLWPDGRSHLELQKRPLQRGTATLGSSNPLASSINNLMPRTLEFGGKRENLVDAVFSESRNPSRAALIPQVTPSQAVPNPLEAFLSNGVPLDQLTKIANNLLNFGDRGDGSKGGILEAMTNVLRGAHIPLPQASFQDDFPNGIAKPQQSMMEKLLTQAASVLNQSLREREEKEKQFRMSKDRDGSFKLIENLPEEEQRLLKAAFTSKELNVESLAPALKSLVKDDTKEESKKEKEDRLLEWIRENRPPGKQHKEEAPSAERLPYYGKYCGSFAEQITAKKRFKSSGAVWVVDDKRFIISKFFFQPGSLLSENVTFWIGPLKHTENTLVDMFPSSNGFYVCPHPVDVSVFTIDNLLSMEARPRSGLFNTVALLGGLKQIQPVVEKDEKQDDKLRSRRNVAPLTNENIRGDEDKQLRLLQKDGGFHLNGSASNEQIQSSASDGLALQFSTVVPSGFRIHQPEEDRINYSYAQPLEWFAGFQPLLLTLPEGILTKSVHWISLRDHKRQDTVASVLLPNGPAFQIPEVATLRGFSPNGLFNITSGPIRIVDVRSIVISNFTLRNDGKAIWFMVGKDILPNASGHIVPLYDPQLKTYDCQSLRDYSMETVHLMLPRVLDIKDVFWFSVFSVAEAISLSHIYLPFNEIHVPPRLSGEQTPSCKYTP